MTSVCRGDGQPPEKAEQRPAGDVRDHLEMRRPIPTMPMTTDALEVVPHDADEGEDAGHREQCTEQAEPQHRPDQGEAQRGIIARTRG